MLLIRHLLMLPSFPINTRPQARADIDYILDPYVPVAVPVEAPKLSGIGAALAAAPVPPPPPVPSVKVDDMGNDGIASPPQPPQHVNFSMSFEEDDYDLDGDRSRPIKRRNSGANLAGSFGSAGNFGSLGGFESYQHNSWDATYNYTPAPAPVSGGGGGNFGNGNFGSSNGLSGLAGSLNNNMQVSEAPHTCATHVAANIAPSSWHRVWRVCSPLC